MERCTLLNLNGSRWEIWAALLTVTLAWGCSNSTPGNPIGRGTPDGGIDLAQHETGSDVACLAAAAPRKTLGSACGCDSDCDSGFCIDGVCCASACQDTCKACNVPGMMG